MVRINLVTLILGLLLRAYLTSPTKPPGWLGALSDLKIGASLTRIHNEISRNWQLKELASEAGMSRTAFVERFKRIVGVPPLVYLISWRMQLAKDQLRASDSSLTEIATSVGYVSASAFSYAFKHVVGCLPASHRSGERMCWQQH